MKKLLVCLMFGLTACLSSETQETEDETSTQIEQPEPDQANSHYQVPAEPPTDNRIWDEPNFCGKPWIEMIYLPDGRVVIMEIYAPCAPYYHYEGDPPLTF